MVMFAGSTSGTSVDETALNEPLFVGGLRNISEASQIRAVICIQSKFYQTPVYPATAKAALASLDPNNFYSGSSRLRESWNALKDKITVPHYWIRVSIYIVGQEMQH